MYNKKRLPFWAAFFLFAVPILYFNSAYSLFEWIIFFSIVLLKDKATGKPRASLSNYSLHLDIVKEYGAV